MAEECRLHALAAVVGQRRRARELRHTLMDSEACAAGDETVAPRDEALEARGCERVAEDLLDDLAAELFVTGRAVERVGIEKAGGDGVHPRRGVLRAGTVDRDVARADLLQARDIERQTEDVLESDELVTAVAQHPRDGRISERRELHLQWRVTQRERFFDCPLARPWEESRPEAKSSQLVRRRARPRVHRHAAANRRYDDLAPPQPRRRGARELHQHRALGAFNPGGERGSSKHDRRTAYRPAARLTTRFWGNRYRRAGG